jgi:hypothetical protein
MTYENLGPIFTDKDLPPDSPERAAFLAHVAQHPWPPLAHVVPAEHLLDTAGDYDGDWGEWQHSAWAGAPTTEDPVRAQTWLAWGEQEQIKIKVNT